MLQRAGSAISGCEPLPCSPGSEEPTMASRPSAVAFDVVETLMPLEPLTARFERAGLPASALREWFTRLLLYGVGLSAAGDYVPFPDVAAEALRAVSGYR